MADDKAKKSKYRLPKGSIVKAELTDEQTVSLVDGAMRLYETAKKLSDFLKSNVSGVSLKDLMVSIRYNPKTKCSCIGFSINPITIKVELSSNLGIEGSFVLVTFISLIQNAVNVKILFSQIDVVVGSSIKEVKQNLNIIQNNKNLSSISINSVDSGNANFVEYINSINDVYFNENSRVLSLPIEVLSDTMAGVLQDMESASKTYDFTQAVFLYLSSNGFICLAQSLVRYVRSAMVDYSFPQLVTESGEQGYIVFFFPRSLVSMLSLCSSLNLSGEVHFAEEETFIKISIGDYLTAVYANNNDEFYEKSNILALDIMTRFSVAEEAAQKNISEGKFGLVKPEESFNLQVATLSKATSKQAVVTITISDNEESDLNSQELEKTAIVGITTNPLEPIQVDATFIGECSNTLTCTSSFSVPICFIEKLGDNFFGYFQEADSDENHPLYRTILVSNSMYPSIRTQQQLISLDGNPTFPDEYEEQRENTSSESSNSLNEDDIPF